MKLLAALVFLSTPMAYAQTVSVDTITVRGTKENKTYIENTESVTLLREKDLPATGTENGIQSLNAAPNVQVNKNGESFSIRGISNVGVTGYQKDNLSSVVIDDLFQTDLSLQAGSFDLFDLDRIEILKGAQSTSQGVNALAGLILLDHRKPAEAAEGAAKFGLGSFWYREAGVVSNHSLSEKLKVRVSYTKELTNGYLRNITTGDDQAGHWDKDRAALTFGYKTSATSALTLTGKFNQARQGATYSQGSDPFARELNEDVGASLATRNNQLIARHEASLSESLKSSTTLGYSGSKQDSSSDADGGPTNQAGVRNETHDDRFISVESRLNYTSGSLSNLVGVHLHDFKLRDDYDFALLYPLSATTSTPINVLQGVDRTRRTYALFDSVTYRLTETQSVLAGIRGELVESTYGTNVLGTRLQNLGAGPNATLDTYLSQISGSYDGSQARFNLLPKLGYVVQKDQHAVGFTYTRGYRTSGVSINRRRATAVEYAPEFTNNYELSYKFAEGTSIGDQTLLSANAFYIDWRDQQVQVQLSNDFYDTQVSNAAKSRVLGGELEARAPIGAQQTLSAGIGYVDTKFEDFPTRTGNLEGNKFPFASNWTTRLSHEYRPTQDLTLLTVLRSISGAFTNAENTRRSDAQFYLNLNAKYALRSWLIEAYANNVLDGQSLLFDGTPTSSTSPYKAAYHQISTPRELGARLNYFW